METRTVCKASPHIIIYGAREPVPPQQAPWPIKKGSEVWGGGARLRREKCLGRKYFYVLLISGSCLALPRMCFQSGINSRAQDLERGHEAQALLCGSTPLSPLCSSGWELWFSGSGRHSSAGPRSLSLAPTSETYMSFCDHMCTTRAFILIEASHLDIGWQAFLGYCRPLLGPSRSPREGCGILSLLPPALQFQCIVTC